MSKTDEQVKIQRAWLLYKAGNTPFMRSILSSESANDNEMVSVKVPGAGGGLVSTQVPLTYLKEYLSSLGKEYLPLLVYTINDPDVVLKVKSEKPEYFADPINNSLNWLMLGGAGVGRYGVGAVAKGAGTALKTAGLFFTPSTWIGGGMLGAGYVAPNWLLNAADLGASLYFGNEAANQINKNGLNLETGVNAALALAPFTRDEKAVQAVSNYVKNPTTAIKSVVEDFRAARRSNPVKEVVRAFNNGVQNSKITVLPVKHTSPYGITNGSVLNVGEEGIHMVPIDSKITPNIERYFMNLGIYPHTRIGTWTFSDNTAPVWVEDKGGFWRGLNPDFDAKVDKGVSNFIYGNKYEGKINGVEDISFATTEPNWGLLLSRNTSNNASRIDWDTQDVITPEGIKLADGTLISQASGHMNDLEKYFNPMDIFYEDIIVDGVKVGTKEVYLQNGRLYSIDKYPKELVVKTPEGSKSFSFPTDGNILDILNGKSKAIKSARHFILDSRDKWIQSLDDIPLDIVRRSLIAPESLPDKFGNRDLTLLIDNSKVSDYIKASVKSDIDNVYLSNEYIDRYLKASGLDPEKYRQTAIDILKEDLETTYKTNSPIFYLQYSGEGGISNSRNRIYGINGNADLSYFDSDWSSVIFHEFGHNLYGQNTPTGKFISSYTRKLLNDNPVEYSLNAEFKRATNPKAREYIDYLSSPNEFRQRIMEGVRYGIKEGLTPEEIYNECKVTGFVDLKKNFTKQYLVKMLGLMLGTAPIIINSKENDKNS